MRWSGWRNPYDTAEEASAEKCNSKPGCTEIWNQTEILQSGNLAHQTLKTYYLDENGNLKIKNHVKKLRAQKLCQHQDLVLKIIKFKTLKNCKL